MKNMLVFLAMILCLQVQAQDGNNNLSSESWGQASLLLKEASMLNAFVYDTVRSIDELNTPNNAEAFPWISPNGNRLYYTNGADSNKMHFAFRSDTSSPFINMGAVPINVSMPTCYWLTADELGVYICAQAGVYYASRTIIGNPFGTPVLLNFNIPITNPRSVSLDASGQQLFVYEFGGAYEGISQHERVSATDFNFVRMVPPFLGFDSSPGQLSKDGLTYFFSTAAPNQKLAIYQLTRLSAADSFMISTLEMVQGINDTGRYNIQPSMSDNLDWVAFVQSDDFFWAQNNLYIAHKNGSPTPVFEHMEKQILVAYPNPTPHEFCIESFQSKTRMEIYNALGIRVNAARTDFQGKTCFDVSGLAEGMYFLSLPDIGKSCKVSVIATNN